MPSVTSLTSTAGTGAVTVALYAVPLNTLGLDGAALTVFASGFLDPTQNSNGEAFELWVALANGTTLPLPIVTSVNELAFDNLVVYPNPSNGVVNITGFSAGNDYVTMQVTDLSGRVVKRQSLATGAGMVVSFNIEDLADGNYVLQVISNDTQASFPLSLNR